MPKARAHEEVIKKFIQLKGVGPSKADALYKAGYTSINKLREASVEELSAVEGISEQLARSIHSEVQELELKPKPKPRPKPKPKPKAKRVAEEIEEGEEEVAEEEEVEEEEELIEIEEEEEAEELYRVHPKPVLAPEVAKAMRTRAEIKRRKPEFRRQEWFRYKRLGTSWRKPRGLHSKTRMHRKYRGKVVRIGYGSPRTARGRHPSGFEEVIVYNVEDLKRVEPSTQAVRIGHSVGFKKRERIIEAADELGIRVLNRGEF